MSDFDPFPFRPPVPVIQFRIDLLRTHPPINRPIHQWDAIQCQWVTEMLSIVPKRSERSSTSHCWHGHLPKRSRVASRLADSRDTFRIRLGVADNMFGFGRMDFSPYLNSARVVDASIQDHVDRPRVARCGVIKPYQTHDSPIML